MGVVIILLAIAALIPVLVMPLALAAVLGVFNPSRDPNPGTPSVFATPGAVESPNPTGLLAVPGVIIALGLILCLLILITGIGVYRGRPRAFSVAIVLFLLAALSGNGPAMVSVVIALYCGLRRLDVIKPTPADPANA